MIGRGAPLAALALALLLLPSGVGRADGPSPAAAKEAAKEAEKAEVLADRMAKETPPGTGFEGRAVVEGQPLPGATVHAYRTFDDFLANRPAAVSAPADDTGTWKIDLPRGKYYLVAKKRAGGGKDGPLAPGDSMAFHGSNPITVVPGKYTHVGFSLAPYAVGVTYEEGPDPATGSLEGTVVLGKEPGQGIPVLLYVDGKNDFRGAPVSSSPPTAKEGKFRVDYLVEADYFVLARKRSTGKAAGPLTDGDVFGYYVANPVHVKAGKVARISFAVISKAGEIGKEDSLFRDTGTYVAGRITDKAGKPVKGVYGYAYLDKAMAQKRPDYISKPAGDDGRYVINLPHGGTYFVGARADYGDTPGYGEWFGRYEGTGDHSVKVETGKVMDNVDMVVEKILP